MLHFQLHVSNFNPIFLLVYFHASSHALPSISVVFQYSSILVLYSGMLYFIKTVSNIPVIFQYYRPILNFSIPLTVSTIPLFLFQLPYWTVFPIWYHFFHSCYVHQLLNSQFSFCPFPLLLLSKFLLFHSSIIVFIIPVTVPSFALLLSVSKFSVSMRRVLVTFHSSFLAWGSASWRHLRDGTRNPSISRPPSTVLAIPACRQFPWLPT